MLSTVQQVLREIILKVGCRLQILILLDLHKRPTRLPFLKSERAPTQGGLGTFQRGEAQRRAGLRR